MKRLQNPSSSGELQSLAAVLDEALNLLEGNGPSAEPSSIAATIQPSLFEQCIELCREVGEREAEPIRTVHHLSCTGGTLITKCLAAMPNVLMLNEVDPLSEVSFNPESPNFTPSDMVALIRQGDHGASSDLLIKIFIENLETLRNELALLGKQLVLRDHSHSHFLMGSDIGDRLSVLQMVSRYFSVRSIVTVRNPLDSYLSLEANGWKSFQPATFDEYCSRYMSFLDAHGGLPIYRYEDFVNEPERRLEQMCSDLKLSYVSEFVDTFDVFRFSGDSGRSGVTIAVRPRRIYNEIFLEEVRASVSYSKVAKRLGYELVS